MLNPEDAGELRMKTDRILVRDSLQETLWRLKEVRRGFRRESDAQAKEALEWMISRQGLENAY